MAGEVVWEALAVYEDMWGYGYSTKGEEKAKQEALLDCRKKVGQRCPRGRKITLNGKQYGYKSEQKLQ